MSLDKALGLEPGTPRPLVVAEIGQCWAGDLNLGTKLVRQCAAAGAWGVKFQFLQPDTIASAQAEPYWDTTRHAGTQAEAFTLAGAVPYDDKRWAQLFYAARVANVEPFATPFDLQAVEALYDLGAKLYKIASGDITNVPLLEAVRTTGRPVILSTGAATDGEVSLALDVLAPSPVALLACTLSYPTVDVAARFGKIAHLRDCLLTEHYRNVVGVGYSDHTLGTWAAGPAVHSGAEMLEKHVAPALEDRGLGRACADDDMALDPGQLKWYVDTARQAMVHRGEVSLKADGSERAAHNGARRSLFAAQDIAAGTMVQPADVVALRPLLSGGIPAESYRHVVGRLVHEHIPKGHPIREADLR